MITASDTTGAKDSKKGDVKKANQYLGYSYYISGTVIDGYKVGRKLGFPTANLKPSCAEKLIPETGVYAVYAYIGSDKYPGMLNIGYRPTLNNGKDMSIEVHIIDFNDNIYYKEMKTH